MYMQTIFNGLLDAVPLAISRNSLQIQKFIKFEQINHWPSYYLFYVLLQIKNVKKNTHLII